jgi:catechol 2,3-dioxygenase-like lactoylglutathione lyase family enzyme
MLGSANVTAFISTSDPGKTRAFYEGVLGLQLVADEPYALVFDANGTMLRAQKVQNVVVVPYTVLGWTVRDIAETVRGLGDRGVTFERYDGMGQDELGVWRSGVAKVAWFKDPEGHLLSLTQHG